MKLDHEEVERLADMLKGHADCDDPTIGRSDLAILGEVCRAYLEVLDAQIILKSGDIE